MLISDIRRAALLGTLVVAAVALNACGGGDSSTAATSSAGSSGGTGGTTPAATTLSASSPVTTVTEGDAAFSIALSSTNPADVPITWTTSPGAPAALLSNLSNTGATYTPPAVGTLLNNQVTTVTATAPSGATATLAITNKRKRNYLALVAGNGAQGTADGAGAAAQFWQPYAVAIDTNARVAYVPDGNAHTIRKIDLATDTVSTFAGSAVSGNLDGTGSAAQFNLPTGVAVDAAGNVYVADSTACTIRKITPTAVVTTLAGLAGTCATTDGTGAAARLNQPFSLAIDQAGNLYVTETGTGGAVRKVTPGGSVTTLTSLAAAGGTLGIAVTAAADTLYVALSGGAIVKFSLGAGGTVGASVVWNGFKEPWGLALDEANGLLYVSDITNHTIDKVDASGAITVVAGTAGSTSAFAAGPLPGTLPSPLGLGRDSNGDLYVGSFVPRIAKIVLP